MSELKSNIKPDNFNYLTSLILLLLGIAIWWQCGKFPSMPEGYPGPNLFPMIIAAGLMIIAISIFINQIRNRIPFNMKRQEISGEVSPAKLVLAIIILIVFPWISPLIGFLPSLVIAGLLIGLILQLIWWQSMLVSFITVLTVYLIFSELLGVPL